MFLKGLALFSSSENIKNQILRIFALKNVKDKKALFKKNKNFIISSKTIHASTANAIYIKDCQSYLHLYVNLYN